MEETNKVKLYGIEASTYVKRVEIALKVKGIPYDYIEEDLTNKSQMLLLYNPIHKKVPILVHDGKPVVESSIILEYIDETWNQPPRLLPQHPYERAQTRFWAQFVQDQLFGGLSELFTSEGEDLEKAMEKLVENMNIFEKEITNFFPKNSGKGQSIYFEGGNWNIGLLDIMVSATFGPYKAQEEVIGLKILDPKRNPSLLSWVNALNNHPVIKELLPPHEILVGLIQYIRTNHSKSTNKGT